MLRLTLAGLVALVHAQDIGWGDQPVLGRAQLGDLAVDGFFVISGFLVTRSAVRLPSLRRFAWHRALRILPGFWACLVVTGFGVAPAIAWLQGRPVGAVFTAEDSAPGYVLNNAALLIRQWGVSGLGGAGEAVALDGSLWTLFYEALCYAVVGVLAATGVIRRWSRTGQLPVRHARQAGTRREGTARGPWACLLRRHLLLGLTALLWLGFTLSTGTGLTLGVDYLPRFLLLFLLGSLGQVYAHRIHFTPALVATAVVTLVVTVYGFQEYRPLGAASFAYLLLWAIVALPLRWDPPVDLSYGLYVYHWPMALLLLNAGLTTAGRVVFTLTALALTATAALASWHLVEAPALRHKNAGWIDTWGRRSPRHDDRPGRLPRDATPSGAPTAPPISWVPTGTPDPVTAQDQRAVGGGG